MPKLRDSDAPRYSKEAPAVKLLGRYDMAETGGGDDFVYFTGPRQTAVYLYANGRWELFDYVEQTEDSKPIAKGRSVKGLEKALKARINADTVLEFRDKLTYALKLEQAVNEGRLTEDEVTAFVKRIEDSRKTDKELRVNCLLIQLDTSIRLQPPFAKYARCCDLALTRGCGCTVSVVCPVHGNRCYGSHD